MFPIFGQVHFWITAFWESDFQCFQTVFSLVNSAELSLTVESIRCCHNSKQQASNKWALTFYNKWLCFTMLLKVVTWKNYKSVFIPYFKNVLTIVKSAELSLTVKSVKCCHNSKQQASNKWALTFNKKWLRFTRLLKVVSYKNCRFTKKKELSAFKLEWP